MTLLQPAPRTDPAVVERIKRWAREVFALEADVTIRVAQLRCREPGCPPLETAIVISPPAGATFQRKLHKPAADVTLADLQGAAEHDH